MELHAPTYRLLVLLVYVKKKENRKRIGDVDARRNNARQRISKLITQLAKVLVFPGSAATARNIFASQVNKYIQ